jgi:hypothetical protein
LRASTALRLAQQDLTDQYAEFFGLPTRPEIDDLTRTVADLRREIRAARRAAQKPAREFADGSLLQSQRRRRHD